VFLFRQCLDVSVSRGCYDGPQLTLKCGKANSVDEVSEPETCHYISTLTTPLACGDNLNGRSQHVLFIRRILERVGLTLVVTRLGSATNVQ
jgi:hypothetical protein